jgi:hypothetical protein
MNVQNEDPTLSSEKSRNERKEVWEEGKGREGKGREGKGREGKGREGKRSQVGFNDILRSIW